MEQGEVTVEPGPYKRWMTIVLEVGQRMSGTGDGPTLPNVLPNKGHETTNTNGTAEITCTMAKGFVRLFISTCVRRP
jgi:hypothetical protein